MKKTIYPIAAVLVLILSAFSTTAIMKHAHGRGKCNVKETQMKSISQVMQAPAIAQHTVQLVPAADTIGETEQTASTVMTAVKFTAPEFQVSDEEINGLFWDEAKIAVVDQPESDAVMNEHFYLDNGYIVKQ